MSAGNDFSTRKMIITLMKTKGSVSVSELAKQLGVTEMAIRRHIHSMESEGLIESRLERQAVGRPLYMYSLTALGDEQFPKNYQGLTLELLEELENDIGVDGIKALLKRRSDKMLKKYEQIMKNKKTLLERVTELTEIQNRDGYMAELENTSDGSYTFKQYNCPFPQVAAKYDQICSCEQEFIESLVQATVERKQCIVKDGIKCEYIISQM